MTGFPGKNNVGNDIVKLENVFEQEFVSFLHDDCKKQLKYNLLSDQYILSSKAIIDCHGLAVCNGKKIIKDPEFPYCTRNWNLFCMKMQSIMYDYCDKFNLDKSELTPHSCWVERSLISDNDTIKSKIDDTDEWLDLFCNSNHALTHYRVVYFLKNPNCEFGIEIPNKFNLSGEENSLYIIPTNIYDCHTKFSTDTEEQFVLMFDWYLHPKDSPNDPTWTFPNKYNHKLLKKYVKILRRKLPQK